MDVADLPMIDDRNRHALGVRAGHDGVHFGVNGLAGRNGLGDSDEGKAESRKTKSQS
jgi:hypothetical protein